MRRLILLLLAFSLAAHAQTLSKWNGVALGSSSGNVSKLNGVTVGSATGNYAKWDGASIGGATVPLVVHSQAMTSGSFATTLALTNSVTSGNILVGILYDGRGTGQTSSFTHTKGAASSVMGTTSLSVDEDTVSIVCASVTSSGSDTLTFNATMLAVVYEVSGAVCANDVTPATSNTTGATSYTAGPISTVTANDMLFMAGGNDGTNTSQTTAGSGWSGALNASSGSTYVLFGSYRVAASTGSYSASSGTFPSEEQASVVVALK